MRGPRGGSHLVHDIPEVEIRRGSTLTGSPHRRIRQPVQAVVVVGQRAAKRVAEFDSVFVHRVLRRLVLIGLCAGREGCGEGREGREGCGEGREGREGCGEGRERREGCEGCGEGREGRERGGVRGAA